MMREDRVYGPNALCGKGRHQFANSGAEYPHHLVSRNSEMNNSGHLS
ncbi:MAG: hypothetical protein JWO51_2908 [Rhodospirillales bacterium]|nr:hypothetical protein [Rhodospirillales bacterium]